MALKKRLNSKAKARRAQPRRGLTPADIAFTNQWTHTYAHSLVDLPRPNGPPPPPPTAEQPAREQLLDLGESSGAPQEDFFDDDESSDEWPAAPGDHLEVSSCVSSSIDYCKARFGEEKVLRTFGHSAVHGGPKPADHLVTFDDHEVSSTTVGYPSNCVGSHAATGCSRSNPKSNEPNPLEPKELVYDIKPLNQKHLSPIFTAARLESHWLDQGSSTTHSPPSPPELNYGVPNVEAPVARKALGSFGSLAQEKGSSTSKDPVAIQEQNSKKRKSILKNFAKFRKAPSPPKAQKSSEKGALKEIDGSDQVKDHCSSFKPSQPGCSDQAGQKPKRKSLLKSFGFGSAQAPPPKTSVPTRIAPKVPEGDASSTSTVCQEDEKKKKKRFSVKSFKTLVRKTSKTDQKRKSKAISRDDIVVVPGTFVHFESGLNCVQPDSRLSAMFGQNSARRKSEAPRFAVTLDACQEGLPKCEDDQVSTVSESSSEDQCSFSTVNEPSQNFTMDHCRSSVDERPLPSIRTSVLLIQKSGIFAHPKLPTSNYVPLFANTLQKSAPVPPPQCSSKVQKHPGSRLNNLKREVLNAFRRPGSGPIPAPSSTFWKEQEPVSYPKDIWIHSQEDCNIFGPSFVQPEPEKTDDMAEGLAEDNNVVDSLLGARGGLSLGAQRALSSSGVAAQGQEIDSLATLVNLPSLPSLYADPSLLLIPPPPSVPPPKPPRGIYRNEFEEDIGTSAPADFNPQDIPICTCLTPPELGPAQIDLWLRLYPRCRQEFRNNSHFFYIQGLVETKFDKTDEKLNPVTLKKINTSSELPAFPE